MIVRKQGGLTEFVPSPQEKREGILRDHALDLLANLDGRVRRIEDRLGLPAKEAEAFAGLMDLIRREEIETGRINGELAAAGFQHEERNMT